MKIKTKALLLSFFVVLLSGSCIKGSSDDSTLVTPQELADKQDEIVLIDVRTPGEFEQGHLENSINISVFSKNFKEEVEKLDKSQPVYVYCAVGSRSAKATRMLKKMGFEEVYDLDGGIRNWQRSGMKIVK